ncbi:hypothetical protein NC653_025074 [Populus alba x Populus x berolinensis]|uniref:UBX domain-containing protein n=1 Tax=Populus alba x Populus x berolinensis TaxID=444605 RepID=A0AAD6Q9H8_9ROSI|nr:hypothetical protein NC653_025074 [Populus alba x Populus x berolinensis]
MFYLISFVVLLFDWKFCYFEIQAKGAASVQDKWLLVNLQSTKEFSSHMLNRDTWANEAVAQTISTNFIFWQVYDDTSEGRKVCTYYKLDSIPVVLIIDPITGQKMHSWVGMVQPESLLEDLVPFMDGGPRDHHKTLSHKRQRGSTLTPPKSKALVSAYETKEEDEEVLRALAASMESMKDSSVIASNKKDIASKGEEKCSTRTPTYPPLPEEPSGDKSLLCRVGIRLPDGRRVQRNFLKTDPIRPAYLYWLDECVELNWPGLQLDLEPNYTHFTQSEEAGTKLFCLKEAIPGAKRLDYDSTMTFGDSGLANSMISVAWE